jgi:hypothetical protein
MNEISKNLLKNGIKGLAILEEDYFKENIMHALAFKLNESLKEIYEDCSKNLLKTSLSTKETNELKLFVEFVEKFNAGKYEFQNSSVLNIDENDIESVKKLFESLSPDNRQKMVEEIFKNSENFKQHVEFYNKSKGLMK